MSRHFGYLSGRTWTPFQRFSSKVINYPLSSGRQPLLEPFGSRRLDAENWLDLRIEKIFKVGPSTDRIAVYADIQNVFNAGTILSANTRYPELSIAGYDQAVAFGDHAATPRHPRRALELLAVVLSWAVLRRTPRTPQGIARRWSQSG